MRLSISLRKRYQDHLFNFTVIYYTYVGLCSVFNVLVPRLSLLPHVSRRQSLLLAVSSYLDRVSVAKLPSTCFGQEVLNTNMESE